jgi:hypothetical protein
LIAHPDHPAREIKGVSLRCVTLKDGRTMLRYRVDGCGALVIPDYAGTGRADGLWRTTCFEMFLKDRSPAYFEFNFSPSGRWAAYAFQSWREAVEAPELSSAPVIAWDKGSEIFVLTAFLATVDVTGAHRAGFSAVLEERGGHTSYWALAHPPGKPDFHDAACFTARLG